MERNLDRYNRHYNDIFDHLEYQNKIVVNEVADYLKRKKLNRLANKQILTDIANMVLDYQNRALPVDNMFGSDKAAFCDRLSETAPAADAAEKILAFVRNLSALFLLVGVVAIIFSFAEGTNIYLTGIDALKIMGGALVALFYFPLVCYRDALFMTLHPIVPMTRNVIEPDSIGIDAKSLVRRIIYSLVCAAGTIAYVVFLWVYPEALMTSSLSDIKINVLAWVIISAVIFLSSLVGEIYIVTRNYQLNNINHKK